MTNTFYNDFDRQELEPREPDYRSVFERGRDRLMHNAAFRRLQAKTQVFLSGEYDFYRTRLTHSIEVAQIAGSIARCLNRASGVLRPDFHIDLALVEGVALAHDIGHPPFGHAGESTLHRVMLPWGGFEGNAQTLRLITETIFTSGRSRRGLNPTRAFMDGVLKYKTLCGEWDRPVRHFLYDEQAVHLAFVMGGRAFPAELAPGADRNAFRSLECQIMDWADDTAYSLNDLVDSANAGFITGARVRRWADAQDLAPDELAHLDGLLAALEAGNLERVMNRKIGAFVEACRLVERDNFMCDLTNRYRYGIAVASEVVREQKLYARLARQVVFRSPQVSQLEHKGEFMIERIFGALKANYLDDDPPRHALLSGDYAEEVARAAHDPRRRARLLCDYVAGMTDGFASRIYKRLFDPDFGSIVDLV